MRPLQGTGAGQVWRTPGGQRARDAASGCAAEGSKYLLEAGYRYTPPRLGAQALQQVARAALEGHRHHDCYLCGKFAAFAKPSVCVYQKNETLVGSHQALSQFVYKKRETAFGSHQLPPNLRQQVI